jgi:hypothetical protein
MHILQLQPSSRSLSGIHHPPRSANRESVIQAAHSDAGACSFFSRARYTSRATLVDFEVCAWLKLS